MRGKVIDTKRETIENKKGGDPYKKMLVTIESSDGGFSNIHQFELFGEQAIELQESKVKLGNWINIEFYIKSNEWKGRYFVSLNIKDIQAEDQVIDVNDNLPF